jgi:hypothetical protein
LAPPVYAGDGFHHHGPQVAVPTSWRVLTDGPESVVKVVLKAWTERLDAEPGPGRIELQLATAEYNTDFYVELTPGQGSRLGLARARWHRGTRRRGVNASATCPGVLLWRGYLVSGE